MDEPSRRLAPHARWVWALQLLFPWVALAFGAQVVSEWVDELDPWAWLVPLIGLALSLAIVPQLRWARWRWDVRDEGIDIRHGTIAIRRTLVPWIRVQHVDTRRGVLEQSFGLATVVVHTAAGGHQIPLLRVEDANLLRDRIAELARTDPDA